MIAWRVIPSQETWKMPETSRIVTNTGPLLALIAATENLSILRSLYERVLVPREVADEIHAGGTAGFGVKQFDEAHWLSVHPKYLSVSAYLSNTLGWSDPRVFSPMARLRS